MFLSRNKKNNVYPCKPQFYHIQVGFKGVKIIYVCFQDVIDKAVLTSTHNLCFEQKYEKYQYLLSEKLPFYGGKIFSVFE